MNANKEMDEEVHNPDADLSIPEGYFSEFMHQITHNDERLTYIYVFTAIVVATVIITLIRSFIFFTVN